MRGFLALLCLVALAAAASMPSAFTHWNYATYVNDPDCKTDTLMAGVATTLVSCIAYALATVRCPAPDYVEIDPLIQRYACGALLPAQGILSPAAISAAAAGWCEAKNTTNSNCAVIGSYYWNKCTKTGLTVTLPGLGAVPIYERSFCSFEVPPSPAHFGTLSVYNATCVDNALALRIGMPGSPAPTVLNTCFFGVNINHTCSSSTPDAVEDAQIYFGIPASPNIMCNSSRPAVPLTSGTCPSSAIPAIFGPGSGFPFSAQLACGTAAEPNQFVPPTRSAGLQLGATFLALLFVTMLLLQ